MFSLVMLLLFTFRKTKKIKITVNITQKLNTHKYTENKYYTKLGRPNMYYVSQLFNRLVVYQHFGHNPK